jgi:hypothetical protein
MSLGFLTAGIHYIIGAIQKKEHMLIVDELSHNTKYPLHENNWKHFNKREWIFVGGLLCGIGCLTILIGIIAFFK